MSKEIYYDAFQIGAKSCTQPATELDMQSLEPATERPPTFKFFFKEPEKVLKGFAIDENNKRIGYTVHVMAGRKWPRDLIPVHTAFPGVPLKTVAPDPFPTWRKEKQRKNFVVEKTAGQPDTPGQIYQGSPPQTFDKK